MTDGMNATDLYVATSVALSAAGIAVAAVYLWRVAGAYRQYHDDRAAIALAKGVGLLVIAIGLFISALGLTVSDPQLATVGLSVARGALIVLLVTLLLADIRPKEDR